MSGAPETSAPAPDNLEAAAGQGKFFGSLFLRIMLTLPELVQTQVSRRDWRSSCMSQHVQKS